MNKCARAIICIDNEYVFIKRIREKNGQLIEYYATVGGHIDNDETYEEALYREVYEELGVTVKSFEFVIELNCIEMNKVERFYKVELNNNNFTKGNGPEFTNINFERYGSYEVVRIKKDEICNYNILPYKIKEYIME